MGLLPIHGGGHGGPHHRHAPVVAYAQVADRHLVQIHPRFSWYRNSCGYPVTDIRLLSGKTRMVQLHQMIWFLMGNKQPLWPLTIDHKDRDRLNALPDNLREADQTLQKMNQGLRSSNTSGHKGVFWSRRGGKWYSQIKVKGITHHLGTYSDIREAVEVYRVAHRKFHGFDPIE